jgi:hypothetical protein
MVFDVHIFNNENEAIEAINVLDIALGYPRGDATHYTEYFKYNTGYYIHSNGLTIEHLQALVIQLTINTTD